MLDFFMLDCWCWFISFSECVENLKDIVIIITALIGAVAAYKGLNTWRRQISGQHKHETAMKLLRSLIQVRDKIAELRNPISTGNIEAFREIEGRDPIDSEEISKKDYLRIIRSNKLSKALNDLYNAQIDTEIVFSELVIAELEKIRKFIAKIEPAFITYEQAKTFPSLLQSEESKKSYEILYSINLDDRYSQEINSIVTNVRKLLKEYIE